MLSRKLPRRLLRPLRRFSTVPPRSQFQPTAQSPPPPPNASIQEKLTHYAAVRARAVSFDDLRAFGVPPLPQEELLKSAENTRVQLLCGLARRVTDHLSLPYLPATNPSLQSIYALYATAFSSLASVPEIKSLEDNDLLCLAVAKMVEQHSNNIPTLAKGFQESRRYLPDTVITAFLDRAIRNRITMRLTAEQHLSLSDASLPKIRNISPSSSPNIPSSYASPSSLTPTRIGVLDLKLSPAKMVNSCAQFVASLCEATYGVSPPFRIEGESAHTPIGSIGVHLEYILTELLKNAFRATVEFHTKKLSPKAEVEDDGVFRFDDLPSAHLDKEDFPEVVVTIGVVKGVVTIRIRDRGGGVAPADIPNVFSYAFTTVPRLPDPDADPDSPESDVYGGEGGSGYYGGVGGGPGGPDSALKTELGTLAGLGFGLPLSRLYAAYFGGSLDLVSMYGWGTDVYVVLRTV